MQRYYKDIFVYVYRQTQNEELSKDLTQEIFIAMLKSIEGFDAKRASFKTWLYKIASNKIIDSYRSTYYKYVTVVEEVEEGISSSLSMEDLVVLKEETNDILEIISTLSTSIQQIMRLKIFGEMTFPEIGLLLEQSESTVKSKYYAAVKKIKKVMEVKQNGY